VSICVWLILYVVLIVRLNKDYSLERNNISDYDFSLYGSITLTSVFAVISLVLVLVQSVMNAFGGVLFALMFFSWIVLLVVPIIGNINAANKIHATLAKNCSGGGTFRNHNKVEMNYRRLNIVNLIALTYGTMIFSIHLYLVFSTLVGR